MEAHDVDLGGAAAADDPLAEVPADPGAALEDATDPIPGERPVEEGDLGGEGATLDEMQAAEEGLADPEAETTEPEDEPESDLPEPDEAALPEAEPDPQPEPEPTPDPEAETPEPEPQPEPEPTPKQGKRSSRGSRERAYITLVHQKDGSWVEPEKLAGKKRLKAFNGPSALRTAYRELSEDGTEKIELVCIPTRYWNPQPVKGRERKDYAIDIG